MFEQIHQTNPTQSQASVAVQMQPSALTQYWFTALAFFFAGVFYFWGYYFYHYWRGLTG